MEASELRKFNFQMLCQSMHVLNVSEEEEWKSLRVSLWGKPRAKSQHNTTPSQLPPPTHPSLHPAWQHISQRFCRIFHRTTKWGNLVAVIYTQYCFKSNFITLIEWLHFEEFVTHVRKYDDISSLAKLTIRISFSFFSQNVLCDLIRVKKYNQLFHTAVFFFLSLC